MQKVHAKDLKLLMIEACKLLNSSNSLYIVTVKPKK